MSKSQLKRETAWCLRVKRAERYGSRRVKSAIRWMRRDNYTAGEIVESLRHFCGLKI